MPPTLEKIDTTSPTTSNKPAQTAMVWPLHAHLSPAPLTLSLHSGNPGHIFPLLPPRWDQNRLTLGTPNACHVIDSRNSSHAIRGGDPGLQGRLRFVRTYLTSTSFQFLQSHTDTFSFRIKMEVVRQPCLQEVFSPAFRVKHSFGPTLSASAL